MDRARGKARCQQPRRVGVNGIPSQKAEATPKGSGGGRGSQTAGKPAPWHKKQGEEPRERSHSKGGEKSKDVKGAPSAQAVPLHPYEVRKIPLIPDPKDAHAVLLRAKEAGFADKATRSEAIEAWPPKDFIESFNAAPEMCNSPGASKEPLKDSLALVYAHNAELNCFMPYMDEVPPHGAADV